MPEAILDRGVLTKSPGKYEGTTLPGDTDGLHLKTGSCICYTDNRDPSLSFSSNLQDLSAIVKNNKVSWINIPVDDVRKDGPEVAQAFGFTTAMVETLLKGRYSSFEDKDTELGLMLPAIVMEGMNVYTHEVFVLIRDGLILTIHDRKVTRFARFIRYVESFVKRTNPDWSTIDQLTLILIRLIDENNRRNFISLKNMTSEVDNLQRALANERLKISKVGVKIQRVRHTLVNLLSILWENYDVMHVLQHGDIQLISTRPILLERLNKIMNENSTYIQLGENLANIVGSGSQVMQDYHMIRLLKMNNVLQFVSSWLGILGTIFLVPNTIATAMAATTYNLKPSDAWWYTTLLVVSIIISSFVSYAIIRRIWDVTMAQIEKRRLVLIARARYRT